MSLVMSFSYLDYESDLTKHIYVSCIECERKDNLCESDETYISFKRHIFTVCVFSLEKLKSYMHIFICTHKD